MKASKINLDGGKILLSPSETKLNVAISEDLTRKERIPASFFPGVRPALKVPNVENVMSLPTVKMK